jgi:MFS transporter, OFA family, oxalate/formate antiporter
MLLGTMGFIPGGAIPMGLYLFISGFGSFAGYSSGLVTNVRNFAPEHRGKITGILVSAYGLSAAIVSRMNSSLFGKDVVGSLFFLTLVAGCLPLLGVLFVQLTTDNPTAPKNDPKRETLGSLQKPLSSEDPPVTEETANLLPPPPRDVAKYGEITGLKLLINPDFILLFCTQLLGCGVGLLFINTVGEIIKSWRITDIAVPTFVIVLSLSNCAGRLIFGLSCDLVKKIRLPPSALLFVCLFLLAIGHLLMIFVQTSVGLMIGTILTGLSYGGQFAVIPIVLNTYYGDKYYATNVGMQALSVAAGVLLLSLISGKIYDSHAIIDGDGVPQCYGSECWQGTFIMTAALAAAAHLFVVILVFRERRFDARRRMHVETYD